MDATVTKSGEANLPPTPPRTNRADVPLLLRPPQESVEALEEALATAHQRLQQRMADEIEQQRHEADRLRRESEQARAEAEAILAQANETAQGITAEANKAAERRMAEAGESAARILSQAHDTANTMLTRLRDQAGTLFASAAEEMEAVQVAIVAIQSIADADQAKTHQANREILPTEAVVTRLIVRPNTGANTRTRIRDRLDAVLGIDGVKLGAAGDESFELLLIHQRDANVVGGLLAIAPDEILLTSQTRGCIAIELTGLDWLEPSSGLGSQPG